MKTATVAELGSPHRGIRASDAREAFTIELLDDLWTRYRSRVPYVAAYEEVVRQAGATFLNDHIAFRTFACQNPPLGIYTVGRLFEALGYVAEACYSFPDKHLGATHYRHPNPRFPKLFISELKTWELPDSARAVVSRALREHRRIPSDADLRALREIERCGGKERAKLLAELSDFFHLLPWPAPRERDLLLLDRESQYAAWVLAHGYEVNHFTASVDSHGPGPLEDIEKTVRALRKAGVPMKPEIEGEPGSKLRQSATEAAVAQVSVRSARGLARIPWAYAYFEIAQRGFITDPETGRRSRFEGFLGGQAARLFEMTRRKRQL